MKHWTRLCFYRNFASFTSINSICHNYPRKVNIVHEKLYHKTSATLCTNIRKLEINHHKSDLELRELPIPELLDSFNSRLAQVSDISSVNEILADPEIHSRLVQCVLHLRRFTNDQLLQFMDSLLIIKSKDEISFHKHKIVKNLMKHVNSECWSRSSKMDLPTILPIMEKFSGLARKRYGYSFLNNLVAQHNSKLHKQPADLLFRFVSVVNKHQCWRSASPNPYEFEYYLEQNFNQLDVTQITTLINVLIQRNQPIVSFELKKTIFLYFLDNLHTMSHTHLFFFLDLFCAKESFCINMKGFTSEFLRLLDTFEEKFDTFSLRIVAMVGFLSTKMLAHRPEYLEKLYQRLLKEGGLVQKLTLDHIVYTLFFFNHRSNDEEAYSKILEIITTDRLKLRYKNTKRYIRLISWFCNMGFYYGDLINEVLDEAYLKKTYSDMNRFSMYPYPLVIDLSIDVEFPDYKGNRLSSTMRHELLKCYDWELMNYHSLVDCHTDPYQLTDDTEQIRCKDAPDIPYCDILKQIGSKLNTLYDAEITYVGYVLPHMPRPNLLFCLNENKLPQNLEYLKKTSSFVDWTGLDFKHKWYAVTVLIRNTALASSEAVPLGIEVTKIRQLQKINFNVIGVVQDEWISMSDEEKISFCSNLIQ